MTLEPMVGQVLPSAWNIDEQLKMMPFAAKFHELIISMLAPTDDHRLLVREDVHEQLRLELTEHGQQPA